MAPTAARSISDAAQISPGDEAGGRGAIVTKRPVPWRSWPLPLAAALFAASLALFWPGTAMYDSVAQYRQAMTGDYDDWHPPAMARLWSLFGAAGAAPMLTIQLALYWLGFGLLAAALARAGRGRAAVAVIAIGAWPPLLGWQAVVLKDTQMLGALLAATGIVGWWRLRGARVPAAAALGTVVLIGYAVLVRANAVFAGVPLAIGLLGWPRHPATKAAAGIAATLAVLALAPVINHRVLHAAASGVERTQALYDLAGIAVRVRRQVGQGADTGLQPAAIRAIVTRRCWSPFFWDPLGDPLHCDAAMAAARTMPVSRLYVTLAQEVAHHPLAYAAARLSHLNSTERWLVPVKWPGAAPPAASEPNTLGLGDPGRAARRWQALAALAVETPLGWPILWVVAAATALAAARQRPRDSTRDLATALLVSALTLEASFALLSIASDLRYHLWPMAATALGIVLLADRRWPRPVLLAGSAAMLVVLGGGTAARMLLPIPPQTYAGMLAGAAASSISF